MYNILLTYFSFAIFCLLVVGVFITATTYIQLGIGILLYPILAFFAYKIFKKESVPAETHPQKQEYHRTEVKKKVEVTTEELEVIDINKRAFLKIVGATGLSFFLISTFSRGLQSLLFGQTLVQTPQLGNLSMNQAPTPKTSPTDGYNISEVDDGIISFYGFINNNGGWFIMKGDTNSGTFRYAKGTSNFPYNWKSRKDLDYDYFHRVFLSP